MSDSEFYIIVTLVIVPIFLYALGLISGLILGGE